MVKLPSEFAATWFPGYFWNVYEERLYSLKIDGILKPLKLIRPNHFNNWKEPGYRVSVGGFRRVMPLSRLKKLTCKDEEIPVKDGNV